MTIDYESILQEAHDLARLIEEKKSKLPHDMNLVDLLHANENAHTRILCSLLRFEKNRNFPIADKFLEMLKKKCHAIRDIAFEKPQFHTEDSTTENRRIDLHIFEDEKYSLILENKVNFAGDQPNQLGHYASDVTIKHKVKQSNVYVIYLTRDHNENVSESTISKEDRINLLDWKSEKDTGRLILLNYKEDILPWIENEVLPSCEVREQILISALTQYVDHLKGLFNLREGEKRVMADIRSELIKKLCSENGVEKLQSHIVEVQELLNNLCAIYNDELLQKCKENIISDLSLYFDKSEIEVNLALQSINIKVRPTGWNHYHFLLTQFYRWSYGMGAFEEGYDSTKKIFEMLRSKNFCTDREYNDWWPYCKSWAVTGNPWNLPWKELWKKLYNGEVDAKWLAIEFKQIYDVVEAYARENNIEL